MRSLFLSWDRIGPSMAGSAIRSLELARAVARRGIEVTIAAPAGSELPENSGVELIALEEGGVPRSAAAATDSVFLPGGMELMTALHKPLVVDLYDPFILSNLDFFGERFDRGGARALLALRWLQHHLANGDCFLAANAIQRRFWLGMLASAGRLNRANYRDDPELRRLLRIVPFGLPQEPPAPGRAVLRGETAGIGAADKIVLWAGGMWNWVDPITLVHAVAKLRETRPEVKAVFLGARHPNAEIGEMQVAREARELASRLDPAGEAFFFLDWVPYEQRHLYLAECDVGVSLHRPGVESEFAFRTRVLDYIWCGRPMVLTEGDELAARVAAAGLGRIVAPGESAAIASAIASLLDEGETTARREAFATMRQELAWDRVVEPLADFCADPHPACDAGRSAWVAGVSRADAPAKEDALVADEFFSQVAAFSPSLGEGHACRQSFCAAFNGLAQIDIWLRTENVAGAGNLCFELRHGGKRIARVTAPLGQVIREGWQRFEFRPILASRGRDFQISLRVTHDTAAAVGPRVHTRHTSYATGDDHAGCHPAFIARYLVAGVMEETAADPDDFLFLHNTTLPVLPGDTDSPTLAVLDGDPIADADGLRVALATATGRLLTTERRIDELEARLGEAVQKSAPTDVHHRRLPFSLYSEVLRAGRLSRHAGRALVQGMLLAMLALAGLPLALIVALGLLVVDLLPRRGAAVSAALPDAGVAPSDPVSIVIPTWNGRDLLEMSLPPLAAAIRAHGHPDDEVIVVDNASNDDTIAYLDLLQGEMPWLRCLRMERNEGFAGATNRGAQEARNPALLLLNNDMVVEPDFLQPLLDAFGEEPDLFGVSAQIDFIDRNKPRWETGKVHARFEWGTLRLFHLDRFEDDLLYPVFFAGGGASLYDRARFLALGGFDEAVFSPVYIEDTDLGYRAWRRGWPSVLAPRSRVHHKHRGTTLRRWSEATIHSFFVTNLAALVWKNVSSWRLLLPHLAGLAILPTRVLGEIGPAAGFATLRGLFRQLPAVLAARRRERNVERALTDADIFRLSRSRAAYRGRFHPKPALPERPQVLVISPWSPVPALHGGAVRISNLLRETVKRADITLLSLADTDAETDAESLRELGLLCRDVVLIRRDPDSRGGGWLAPGKLRGFHSPRLTDEIFEWMERRSFDIVQVEYTHMAHFLPPATDGVRRVLVEHDVSFVALARARGLPGSWLRWLGLWMDGLRTFRHEIHAVEAADRTILMSDIDRDVLANYVDRSRLHVVPNGVDCESFFFAPAETPEPCILFVGFYRHEPNVEAALYFAQEVLPRVREEIPEAKFRIVGAYPPAPILDLAAADPHVEVSGRVPETGPEYRAAPVFVAPVLRGSGTRLKILEAMASGTAVVSTTIGAEGLGADASAVALADDAQAFADAVVGLLRDPVRRRAQVEAARRFVAANYDWPLLGQRLFNAYGWEEGHE
ncbi:MAG: glycosyltransferase [Deltaproteobacteria bacterium]